MYILGPVSARLFRKKALMAIYGSKKDLILCPTSDNDDNDNVDEMKTLLNNVYPEITEVQRSADKTCCLVLMIKFMK